MLVVLYPVLKTTGEDRGDGSARSSFYREYEFGSQHPHQAKCLRLQVIWYLLASLGSHTQMLQKLMQEHTHK